MNKSLKIKKNYGIISQIKGLKTHPKESHNQGSHHKSIHALVKDLAQRSAEEYFQKSEDALSLPDNLEDGI